MVAFWLILKGLTIVDMPMETRKKIVEFAFFDTDAPERKAN